MKGRHSPDNVPVVSAPRGEAADGVGSRRRVLREVGFWVSVGLTVALAAYMAYLVVLVVFTPIGPL